MSGSTHRLVADQVRRDQAPHHNQLAPLQRALMPCSPRWLSRKGIADKLPLVGRDGEDVDRRIARRLIELLAAIDF